MYDDFKTLIEIIKPEHKELILHYIKEAKTLESKINILQFRIYLEGYFMGLEVKDNK